MGWWDTGVLGDTPLDIICGIEVELGVEELYPIEDLAERPDRAQLVAAFEGTDLTELAKRVTFCGCDEIAAQAVAVVAMAVGATLGDFAEHAKATARNDPWANGAEGEGCEERRAAMDALVAQIDAYNGAPTAVPSPGLFEKFIG